MAARRMPSHEDPPRIAAVLLGIANHPGEGRGHVLNLRRMLVPGGQPVAGRRGEDALLGEALA